MFRFTSARQLQDIPDHFLMTKEEMLFDLAADYMQPDSDMSWDDLCEEAQLIEAMFEDENI